jgi:hypothetical protein
MSVLRKEFLYAAVYYDTTATELFGPGGSLVVVYALLIAVSLPSTWKRTISD